MASASGPLDASVLCQPRPERCSCAALQGVGSDADHARPASAVRPHLASFEEETDTTPRPTRPTIAFYKTPSTPESLGKLPKKPIEPPQLGKPFRHDSGFPDREPLVNIQA